MASSVIVAVQSVTNGANDEKLACKVTWVNVWHQNRLYLESRKRTKRISIYLFFITWKRLGKEELDNIVHAIIPNENSQTTIKSSSTIHFSLYTSKEALLNLMWRNKVNFSCLFDLCAFWGTANNKIIHSNPAIVIASKITDKVLMQLQETSQALLISFFQRSQPYSSFQKSQWWNKACRL